MEAAREILRYFIPRPLQVFYSAVIALIVTLYWCRDQLLYTLTSSAQSTPSDFGSVIHKIVSSLTENVAGGFLSVALFWILVGLLLISIVYESVNIFILISNDLTIASTYTEGREFKRWLTRDTEIKFLLGLVFLMFALVSFTSLLPLWHNLLSQPAQHFFDWGNILKEQIGFFGLVFNIYFLWKWFLLIIPRFI